MLLRFHNACSYAGYDYPAEWVGEVRDDRAQQLIRKGLAVEATAAKPERADVQPAMETATRKRGRPRKVVKDVDSTD